MDKPVASTKAANSFFKLASFGKRMEFSIISEMLCQGLDVYRPMVDDKGIDAVIRRDDGTYVEVQIKARSNDPDLKVPGAFCAVKCTPRTNYWFVFHIAQAGPNGTMWIMRSDEFTDRASKNINGKNKDKYSLHLCGTEPLCGGMPNTWFHCACPAGYPVQVLRIILLRVNLLSAWKITHGASKLRIKGYTSSGRQTETLKLSGTNAVNIFLP